MGGGNLSTLSKPTAFGDLDWPNSPTSDFCHIGGTLVVCNEFLVRIYEEHPIAIALTIEIDGVFGWIHTCKEDG